MITVPKLWPDSTIACLATGPSLTEEDVQYLRGKMPVIAINDAWQLAPWADVLYSSDRSWWPHYKGVPKFPGMKYGVGSGMGKANPYRLHPEITVLRNTGWTGLELDPSGLKTGKNSGYAALNLAVHFGAKRILLLGYNMSHLHGKCHFFGNHPPNLQQTASLFPNFRRSFDTLVEPLKEQGIEVINCTKHTSLQAFPCGELREVLKDRLAVAS